MCCHGSRAATSGDTSQGSSRAQRYTVTRTGLTQQGADNLAAQTYTQIKRKTRGLRVMLFDAYTLMPWHSATLLGSGTSLDAVYFVKSIERECTADDLHIAVSTTTDPAVAGA